MEKVFSQTKKNEDFQQNFNDSTCFDDSQTQESSFEQMHINIDNSEPKIISQNKSNQCKTYQFNNNLLKLSSKEKESFCERNNIISLADEYQKYLSQRNIKALNKKAKKQFDYDNIQAIDQIQDRKETKKFECCCGFIGYCQTVQRQHLKKFSDHFPISSFTFKSRRNIINQKYFQLNLNCGLQGFDAKSIYQYFKPICLNWAVFEKFFKDFKKFNQLNDKQKNQKQIIAKQNLGIDKLFKSVINQILVKYLKLSKMDLFTYHKNLKIIQIVSLFILGFQQSCEKMKVEKYFKIFQKQLMNCLDWINKNYLKIISEVEIQKQIFIVFEESTNENESFCSQNDCYLLKLMIEQYLKKCEQKQYQKMKNSCQNKAKFESKSEEFFRKIILQLFVGYLKSYSYFDFL